MTTYHALPEIHWSPHLSHELGEDHRTTVGKDHVHDAVDLGKQGMTDESLLDDGTL